MRVFTVLRCKNIWDIDTFRESQCLQYPLPKHFFSHCKAIVMKANDENQTSIPPNLQFLNWGQKLKKRQLNQIADRVITAKFIEGKR